MNPNTSLPTIITSTAPLLFKIGILSLIFLYLLFLLIVLKQVKAMNTTVTQPDLFPFLQFLTFLLIFGGIFIFLLGIVIL